MAAQNDSNWFRRLAHWTLALAWAANAAILIAALLWIYLDGQSKPTIELLLSRISLNVSGAQSRAVDVLSWSPQVLTVTCATAIALLTLLTMFGGLFVGGTRFRSTRMWLIFTALVAGWLGLVATWPDIYWRGQQRRVTPDLAAAESMAHYLDSNWPADDGELDGVGPFIAYPKGAPTILLPLRSISFPNTTLRFSAVERSTDGTIRFELAGDETGAWLEWRRDDQKPAAFAGGLETRYNVGRQQKLAPNWFLVRYQVTSIGSL